MKKLNYDEVQARADLAYSIAQEINPSAKREYSFDKFDKRCCNGLTLYDCSARSKSISEELRTAGDIDGANCASQIPLFVYAILNREEAIECIHRFLETEIGSKLKEVEG